MDYALKVDNLTKTYGDFALQQVSFALPRGSIMGFVGENGAGKTTTLKAILNLIAKEQGQVEILGLDSLQEEKAIREQLGVVFDESCFHALLTPKEISSMMGRLYRNWDQVLFQRYLQQFRLPEGKKLKEFSRGMRMKLCLAAALSHHPKLLLLDEATSGLDPIVRDEILDLCWDFIQDEERAILISSHVTSDLDKIADYITFIHQGSIVLSRNKDELLADMGILKCSERDFGQLDPCWILRYRKNQFGVEALITGKERFTRLYPDLVVDPGTIETMMLFYVRGEQIC